MKNNNYKYYIVHNKYLANALSFLGFKYYKFDNEDNTISYSFNNTEKFKNAIAKILQLKQECK